VKGIIVQERFMRIAPLSVNLQDPEETEAVIPPRIQGTLEEHALVSEWEISEQDLRDFLREKS
jgi:hypothetical protein